MKTKLANVQIDDQAVPIVRCDSLPGKNKQSSRWRNFQYIPEIYIKFSEIYSKFSEIYIKFSEIFSATHCDDRAHV